MRTANFPSKILDFRGFDSSIILSLRGGILVTFPGNVESTNLNRDNLSREIGRTRRAAQVGAWDDRAGPSCKHLLRLDAMPCRPVPLPAHFRHAEVHTAIVAPHSPSPKGRSERGDPASAFIWFGLSDLGVT